MSPTFIKCSLYKALTFCADLGVYRDIFPSVTYRVCLKTPDFFGKHPPNCPEQKVLLQKGDQNGMAFFFFGLLIYEEKCGSTSAKV